MTEVMCYVAMLLFSIVSNLGGLFSCGKAAGQLPPPPPHLLSVYFFRVYFFSMLCHGVLPCPIGGRRY